MRIYARQHSGGFKMDALASPQHEAREDLIVERANDVPRIVVFTTEQVDRRRATQLFAGVDCVLSFCDEFPTLEEQISVEEPEFSMAFIFHRHSSVWPQAPVPAHNFPCRVAVISDTFAEASVVSSLKLGATYYFDIRESDIVLQARVKASLRRFNPVVNDYLVVAPFRFRMRTREVFRWDEALELRPKEYEFATFLFKNPHRLLTNAELLKCIWSLPNTTDTRRIDTAACRLRKRMPLNSDSGWQLRRVRKKGYRLERIGRT